jgi:hypothetical protein
LPVRTLIALWAIFRRLVFGIGLDELIVTVVALIVLITSTARVLFFEARAALAQHAKIMVSELEIIFSLDPVARELCVARHALVLLEKLRRIATLAILLPVARLAAEVLAPLSTTAAPAAALSIIDQILKSLRLFDSPLAPVQAELRQAPPLTFSFNLRIFARRERPIASGVGLGALGS